MPNSLMNLPLPQAVHDHSDAGRDELKSSEESIHGPARAHKPNILMNLPVSRLDL